MKKKKLNLVEWGDLSFNISISGCPKCGFILKDLHPFGYINLSMCRKCEKFYGLVIQDVTSMLSKDFKKKNLHERD